MTMGAPDDHVIVRVPDQLPSLNRKASAILLAILIELTEVEALDGPGERGIDDC